MPEVTVVIPTYNRATYLKEAIESVLGQTFVDFELIILDNDSDDDTSEVVACFTDCRIKYIKNEVNIGGINNLNKGFEIATGNYIIIFHDDDIMKNNLIETEVNIFDSNSDVVLVGSNIEYINEKGEVFNKRALPIEKDIIFGQKQYIEEHYRSHVYLPCPTIMFRMDFIKKNGLKFRVGIGQCCDAYLWYEINLLDVRLYLIAEPLLKYRLHSNQDSQRNDFYKDLVLLNRNTFKLLSKNGESELLKIFMHSATNTLLTRIMNDGIYGDSQSLLNDLKKITSEPFWFYDSDKTLYKFRLFCHLNGLDMKYDKQDKRDINCNVNMPMEDIELMYKQWLDKVALMNKGITDVLHQYNIQNVVIFGSMTTAYFLYKDLEKENIDVISFLDNSIDKQNKLLCNININPEDWLLSNSKKFDAVIVSVEGKHDITIKDRIVKLISKENVPVFTWKEFIKLA